jgi:hypothetical protein
MNGGIVSVIDKHLFYTLIFIHLLFLCIVVVGNEKERGLEGGKRSLRKSYMYPFLLVTVNL